MHDITDSFSRAVAVTPSDTVAISFGAAPPNPSYARRLWVGSSGTITVITLGGDTVQYNIPAGVNPQGTYIRVNCTQVKATGTSATNIVAEY